MSGAETSTPEQSSEDFLSETTLGGSRGEHPEADNDDPLPRGSTVGRYTVLDCIGAGGMGVVYSAFDPQLDRRVALKVMHGSREGTSSPISRSRLVREAQAMAKLSHPNVITVHDVGTVEDRVFVAMEFIEGTTLRQWQRHEHHDWQEIVHAYVRAGRGLAAAHAAGLVHRDFKPDNVLMGFDGRVLVMDFGLARQASRTLTSAEPAATSSVRQVVDDLNLTRTGAVLGTPAYMAPEQHRGSDTVGPLADQFSFCVSLYEGLYGERPFAGNSMTSLAMNVLEGTVRPAPRDSRIPLWLRRVVLRGLSTDPQDRYPSMDALLAELQRDPPDHRRNWVAAGLIVAVLSLSAMSYVFSRSEGDSRCRESESPIATVWTSTARTEVESALASGGLTYAESTRKTVLDRLDAFASRWTETFRARCELVMQAPAKLQAPDPGLRCLEDGQTELQALLEAYRTAGPEALRDAVEAAETIRDPSRCGGLPPARPDAPPAVADPARTALRTSLARARALADIGQHDAAQAHLPLLLAAAQGRQFPEVQAEALLLQTSLDPVVAIDPQVTERVLRRGLLAASKAQAPHLEARIWMRWLALVGIDRGRAEEARRLAVATEAALARADDPTDFHANLHLGLGALDQFEGRYESALQRAKKALVLRTADPWTGAMRMSQNHHALGLALEGLTRYGEAVEIHGRGLSLREQRLGAQHPAIAESLLRLASALIGVNRPEAAEAALTRARMLLEPVRKIAGTTHPMHHRDAVLLAHVLDTLGVVARSREQFDDAIDLHRQALMLLERHAPADRSRLGYALENLGLAYADEKQHELALPPLQRAFDLWSDTLHPAHPDLAIAHLNLANTLWGLGRLPAALEHYTQARAIWEEILPPDHPLLGYALTGIGRVQLDLGQPLLALDMLERALDIRRNDAEDVLSIAETELLLARALWGSARDPERAIEGVSSARDIVGSYEPFEPSALRRVLEGATVERFTDQLDPAGLSVTYRLGVDLGDLW